MFAGAAREAVFSKPEVIRRVQADFVPVALKAALVNVPPDDEEGRLYREIGRSKIAPQGICVVNSSGKVLNWVTMFDDDKSVLVFLNHAKERFAQFPDAKKPVTAERHMKFPSEELADVKDNGKALPLVERHREGKNCPASPPLRGTVAVHVVGRALDKGGKPVADTVRQEHYVEDRFYVTVAMQEALAKALADAGAKRFRLADDLARLLVSHTYLGQLDVNPVGPPGGKGSLKQCEFWAQQVGSDEKGPARLRVEGKSEARGASRDGEGGDGRLWRHEAKLVWEGLIELEQGRMTRLLLLVRGSEKLKWGNQLMEVKGQADVARLPAGHAIDLGCDVRYGLIGEPVAANRVGADALAPADAPLDVPTGQVPEEARRQLNEALGPPFLVFRDEVQQELKLSEEQKQKLEQRLLDAVQDAMKFFQELDRLNAEDREKKLGPYRQEVQEKLAAFLEETLKAEQLKRLRQLELQQEGPFALGRPDLGKELNITDDQRRQFAAVVGALQRKIEPLVKKAQSDGNPEEIRPQVRKLRKEHEDRIEALLNDAQKKQWKELLGKPLNLDD